MEKFIIERAGRDRLVLDRYFAPFGILCEEQGQAADAPYLIIGEDKVRARARARTCAVLGKGAGDGLSYCYHLVAHPGKNIAKKVKDQGVIVIQNGSSLAHRLHLLNTADRDQ